jgi:hypothetical protein
LLTDVFMLDLKKEECIHRRLENALSPTDKLNAELLVWPAHERYLAQSVKPLGSRVNILKAPNSPEDAFLVAASICEQLNLGYRRSAPSQGCPEANDKPSGTTYEAPAPQQPTAGGAVIQPEPTAQGTGEDIGAEPMAPSATSGGGGEDRLLVDLPPVLESVLVHPALALLDADRAAGTGVGLCSGSGEDADVLQEPEEEGALVEDQEAAVMKSGRSLDASREIVVGASVAAPSAASVVNRPTSPFETTATACPAVSARTAAAEDLGPKHKPMLAQAARLEKMLKSMAAKTDAWKSKVGNGQEALQDIQNQRDVRIVETGEKHHAWLTKQLELQNKRKNTAERRAEIGVVDGATMEARRDSQRRDMQLQQQRRVEAYHAQLQKRQDAAEEAGRQCWLATSVRSIGATATKATVLASAPPSPSSPGLLGSLGALLESPLASPGAEHGR